MSAGALSARRFGLAGRLAASVVTVLGAAAGVSLLLALATGDAADVVATSDAAREHLRAAWHLDGAVPERVGAILARWASGDLGTSWTVRPGAPVDELVAEPALRSLGLLGGALGLALTWGLGLAALGLRWRAPSSVARLVSAAPAFLLAHLAIDGLNEATYALIQRGLVARPDWFALPDQPSALRAALAITVLAVGSGTLADVHDALAHELRALRASAWVEAARARGEPLALPLARNLLPALLAVVGVRAAWLAGGLVVVEQVLHIRGLGSLFWRAAELRDHELTAAIALLTACLVIGARLLCDGARVALDPRLGADRVA